MYMEDSIADKMRDLGLSPKLSGFYDTLKILHMMEESKAPVGYRYNIKAMCREIAETGNVTDTAIYMAVSALLKNFINTADIENQRKLFGASYTKDTPVTVGAFLHCLKMYL